MLRTKEHTAVIEVKSFIDMYDLSQGHAQAAAHAKKLRLAEAMLAVFEPAPEAAIRKGVSGEAMALGVTLTVVALGWV